MIEPLHKNVVLEKEEEQKEFKTKSGIILTEEHKEKSNCAKVVAIGPEVASGIKINDQVVYKSYSGNEVEMDDKKFIIINEEDILAIVK